MVLRAPPRALNPQGPAPRSRTGVPHTLQAPPLTPVPAPPPGPRLPPAPLPPIKPGGSALVPLSSGDSRLGMLREGRSERCEEIWIGVAASAGAAWSPRCSARGCSEQATEMLQPGQTPPTAQKDPKEHLALPGMEARAVCRGAQTAVPVSDLPELPDIESQAVYLGDALKSEV